MPKKTPLYQQHLDAKGKMVDFAGWLMPINYGSQIKEHQQVRQDAGMFDVSHMVILDISGTQAKAWLQKLLANDVDKIPDYGKALYSCMCNEQGGIIDDLIVYHFSDTQYRMVVNAATADKDLQWMEQQKQGFDTHIQKRDDLAMIAIQGPKVIEKAQKVFSPAEFSKIRPLKRFYGEFIGDMMVARTGYTGEDGYEVMLPAEQAADFWQKCLQAGILPSGLGARDTLRLEAGMNLYGTDMDEHFTPLDSGLGWTVALQNPQRHFNGRKIIEQQKQQQSHQHFVGLVLLEKGVLRNHLPLFAKGSNEQIGEITSGSFSPTLQKSIAMARLKQQAGQMEVEIRGRRLAVKTVKMPFVQNGKASFTI